MLPQSDGRGIRTYSRSAGNPFKIIDFSPHLHPSLSSSPDRPSLLWDSILLYIAQALIHLHLGSTIERLLSGREIPDEPRPKYPPHLSLDSRCVSPVGHAVVTLRGVRIAPA
ncbi:uncharacterized protein N7482_009087 [Penicillium canariense]|uniref:Uncharacterized protein n=1 Tax=Penicillium canariense TaxID=189055 RepID=A0A9W9HSB9_9EURO|nr:uncharacterized protein N7482_009087 [Penicillium canariense]KAJ5152609.1 hypothetical protein N7482_009087 [Penicillium canariense]